MKKLINDPADVVSDALRGIEAAHPGRLRVDHRHKLVVRADAPVAGKVGLVSGGGSGHEPLHAGYVGPGMLDAACCGEVFTSPVPEQIMAATTAVDGGAGVLHIVKNYTGDVMNFEMAAEQARAESGVRVEAVVVADDVAVQDSLYTAGRRGVGATVLVEKIVGAAAAQGRDLDSVAELARRVAGAGRSMGVALTSGIVPHAGTATFDIADDELEIGIGIHGEPGRGRVPMAPARQIAAMLVEPILADRDFTSGPVIALLNGMGGTPLIELYLMYGEVAALLERAGVRVARCLVGDYVTSLEMAGCSLTLLAADEEMLALWDAPVDTPGLHWGSEGVGTSSGPAPADSTIAGPGSPAEAAASESAASHAPVEGSASEPTGAPASEPTGASASEPTGASASEPTGAPASEGTASAAAWTLDVAAAHAWLADFAARVHANVDLLTDLDRQIGDADHGANMDRGMRAVAALLVQDFADAAALLKKAGMTLVSTVGGASGPLYGTFFLRLAAALPDGAPGSPGVDARAFGAALRAGYDGVVARGKAQEGDKTMLDALAPALRAYDEAVGRGAAAAFEAATAAANAGRDATIPLVARKGRASYLGERSVGHQDPGATSAALLLESAAATLGR
ncbi:dihydroxyacetone kinase DhaK subunit/dihydroxyacetone kinase phosphoprotein-dependent L subunit [Kineosphaera limosa]|uniref:Dihydroxyacetone kinase n=1 Tax=Kineosphaera limosa NBRC 100340 TaxID=1184609 RepID=K6WWV1_9MICO|nr:dihydroxyacetone kinase subunit DhaK [Kineosphaera limosa]NYE01217.1 dihydroxyacetone kinase DhaK subunit/dihydroxyacetone kinase phosphoprotein-dependent L subunit [Kineosphaera limosa]GAB96582.1 dihydroxyacetone kinase [Kineosphaera limosa NBRC 100340]